jgi:hypothetical protein
MDVFDGNPNINRIEIPNQHFTALAIAAEIPRH